MLRHTDTYYCMADLFQTNVTIGRFVPCNITVMGKWTMP